MIYSVAAALCSTVVLSLMYYYLFTQYRERYVGLWALSWFTYSIKFVFDFLLISQETTAFLIGNQLSAFISGWFLLWGIYNFLGKAVPKWWVFGLVPGPLWITIAIIKHLPFFLLALPTFAFLAVIYIYIGIVFLRQGEIHGVGKYICGCAFIVWGLHKGLYPYVNLISLYASWGYLVSSVLTLIVAIGSLMVYFQKTRENLFESEKRFRLLAENAQDLIYLYRLAPSPGFEYVSPAASAIIGYSPEEHYNNPELGFKIVHPEDRPVLEKIAVAPDSFSGPFNLRWVHKNGKIIWTEQQIVPIHDQNGNISAFEGIARDITERVRAEEVLKRYQLLSEYARDIILFVGLDGQIIEANNAALAAYGYKRAELLSIRIHELRSSASGPLIAAQMEQADKEGILFETVHRRKDGSTFPVEVNSQGTVLGGKRVLVSVVRDITERKLAEEELHLTHQQLLKTEQLKDEFLANTNHELRSPLTAIIAFTELLLDPGTGPLNSLQMDYLNEISDSSKDLLNRVNEIRDLTKIKAGKMFLQLEAFDISEVVISMVRRIRPQFAIKGVGLEVNCPGGLSLVLGDRERVGQVLTNLFSNALKFTFSGGLVLVKVSEDCEGKKIIISVEDNGIGIDPLKHEEVFNMFYQVDGTSSRKHGGTGIGLTLVKSLVEMHGGTVMLESCKGKGSKFSFTLPAVV